VRGGAVPQGHRLGFMAEDRLQSVREHWGKFYEISKVKHGVRQIPIERAIELGSDLEWCIAEINALRREVERLHQESQTGA
jgi:hypothetical protein